MCPSQTVNPQQERLFEELAIDVPQGEVAQFFYGDHRAGYYENYTHVYQKGVGYFLKDQTVLVDFLSFAPEFNDKRQAEYSKICPDGIKTYYNSTVWDELTLLQDEEAVVLRVHSLLPDRLSLCPLLNIKAKEAQHDREDGVLWVETSHFCVGIVAGQGFSVHPLAAPVEFSAGEQLSLCLTAEEENTEFRVVIVFGVNRTAVLGRAKRLSNEDYLRKHQWRIWKFLTKSTLVTSDPDYNKSLYWAKLSGYFFMTEEFGKGIWAGLPWFKNNWGRDTFIALSGVLLVSGEFDEAKQVLRNFARFQNNKLGSREYGRIPNLVASLREITYNTTDGTLWFIRAVDEYLRYTGDQAFIPEIYPIVETALHGATKNYLDENGCLTHGEAETWMDAQIKEGLPWSKRGNRAVEVQALWYQALLIGVFLAQECEDESNLELWSSLAEKLAEKFKQLFWDSEKSLLADRLRPDGSRDLKVRPNQLLVITIPQEKHLLTEEIEALIFKNTISKLLYPYGIASLSQQHPYFHPYHDQQKFYHKDAAYHQGTIWGWNAGFTITALNYFGYTELAYQLTENLAKQILTVGCLGSMSELLDAFPKEDQINPSGTYAQAWSVSEYTRNGYQDYLGFRPNLLKQEIMFAPAIPSKWEHLQAEVPFGMTGRFKVDFQRDADTLEFKVKLMGIREQLTLNFSCLEQAITLPLVSEMEMKLTIKPDATEILLDDQPQKTTTISSFQETIGKLEFQKPNLNEDLPCLKEEDYLKKMIEAGLYE